MTNQDFQRTICALSEVRLEDKAALVCILIEDGSTFISTSGSVQEQAELLDHIASYYESVSDQMKGGRR